jgi:hypothetical protein
MNLILFKRRNTNGEKIQEEMFNVLSYKGNADKNMI